MKKKKQKIKEDILEDTSEIQLEKDYRDNLSCTEYLSESDIECNSDRLNWRLMSERQILSEAFIDKHADKVHWAEIYFNQKLSNSFVDKHIHEIDKAIANLSKDKKKTLKKAIKEIRERELIESTIT